MENSDDAFWRINGAFCSVRNIYLADYFSVSDFYGGNDCYHLLRRIIILRLTVCLEGWLADLLLLQFT